MNSLARVLTRATTSAGLAALGWSVVAQAQTPTVFNACVTPLTGLLYQPREPGKCFLPSHRAIRWTDALGAFFGATSLGGDLSGTLPSPTVTGLRGHPISASNPAIGQILMWDGTLWTPGDQVGGSSGAAGGALTGTYPNPGLADGAVTTASLANASVTEAKLAFDPATQVELDAASATAVNGDNTLTGLINAVSSALDAFKDLVKSPAGTVNATGNPLSWTQLRDVPSGVISGGGASGVAGGDLSGTYPNPIVAKLQGTAVAPTAPTNGQILAFNGTSWTPAESPTGGSGTTGQNSVSRFGTGGITPGSGGFSTVPNLSATINVPANSVTIISTDGGVSVNSPLSDAIAVVDIRVKIDGGSPPGAAGIRRLVAANTAPPGIANWSMQLSVELTPGSHTVEVEAAFASGFFSSVSTIASGAASSVLQGTLTLTTLKR